MLNHAAELLAVLRDGHARHDLVAHAQRELLRVLGGGRTGALRRIRARGSLWVVTGTGLIVAAGTMLVAAALEGVFVEDPDELLPFAAACAPGALLGAAALLFGAGLWRRWPRLMRKPFVRKADLLILAQYPPTEDLLATISASSKGPRGEAALADLEQRLEGLAEKVRRQVRSWGTCALALGAYFTLFLAEAGAILVWNVRRGADAFWLDAETGGGLLNAIGPVIVMSAVGLLGTGLVMGGLGLRRQANWGRVSILVGIWGFSATWVALFAAVAARDVAHGRQLWGALLSVPLAVAACASLPSSVTRALRRWEVVEVCRAARGDVA
jgi:hypothetical protein